MGNLQSSPSFSREKYDVFLSFRGEDTHNCFTSHLYEALRRKQIGTFIDNQLIRGDEISPALTRVIEESKISVVIFSKDYASSKWCLRELVEILKCKEMNNQIVLPVFYRVDPSDVRNQTGSFKDSFVKHEKELQEKMQEEEQDEVQTWRKALTKASKLSGWDSSITRTDATLVDEIVNDICKKLTSGYIPPDFRELIGLKPRIEQIISSLCLHVTTDVRIIGIWGMGGIGKTTLADAIFNQNSNQFEGVCFIQNVREKLENHGGLVSVRKEILSEVLKDRDLKLDSPTIPLKIKERLNCLKVFIVLDDVDDSLKMETFVKGVDGLGQGSRIIITSRDKQVLRNCRVNDDNICEVKGLNCHDALQLFCKNAFEENCHIEDLMVNRLVNFTNGNPLALKVLGSSLYKKSKEVWESVVNKFEPTNLSRKIFDVLKISYDGLEDIEKDIFLDIACFLKGRARDYVATILNDCLYSLRVLIDKSLITISFFDKIEMHDLLEEMGRDIVNKESLNKIGKRSRLWRQEDVLCTLKHDYAAPKLRWLDLSGCTHVTKIPDLSKSPLLESINLKDCRSLLEFPQLCMHVPKLRWLKLSGCTRVTKIPNLSKCNNLTKFPQISGNNITSLDLSGTAIKELHHSIAHLNELKELFLGGCENLETFPSGICNLTSLRHLDLSDCSRLEILPENLGNLKSLKYLSAKRAAIKELPHSITHLNELKELFLGGCGNLETFPSGICNLTSLRHLDLSDCLRLEILPGNLGNLKSLKCLYAKRAAIKELPHSIAHLNGLEKLFFGGCENLETLPSGICNLTSLRHLDLSDCSRLEILPENLGNLKSLNYLSTDRIAICQLPYSMKRLRLITRLFLSDCNLNYIPKDIGCLFSLVELDLSVNNFDGLPQSMMRLWNLRYLHLDNCNMVVSLIDLPPNLTHLSACDCKQLQSIPNELDLERILKTKSQSKPIPKRTEFIFTNCMNLEETAVGNMLERLMKYLHQGYTDVIFCYPGRKVPKWFRYRNEGSSIKFQMTFDSNLKGFAVCAVIAFEKYLFNGDSQHKLGVHFDGTCSDGDQSSPTNIMSETAYVTSRNRTLIESDHVAFGYCYASYSWQFERQLKNYSFEFRLSEESPNYRLKSCGVCPIYFQDPDTDEAGTSGSRFDEEEMEHIGETSGIGISRTLMIIWRRKWNHIQRE